MLELVSPNCLQKGWNSTKECSGCGEENSWH
jgi:hypothetical protein